MHNDYFSKNRLVQHFESFMITVLVRLTDLLSEVVTEVNYTCWQRNGEQVL